MADMPESVDAPIDAPDVKLAVDTDAMETSDQKAATGDHDSDAVETDAGLPEAGTSAPELVSFSESIASFEFL